MDPSQHATLDDWIAEETLPFAIDTATFIAGVAAVVASLGDSVELLGLGEALHGGEDILILRNRLFEALVQAHGYSAIAIESSFLRGRLVDEYVAGRRDLSYESVQEEGFSHGFGRLEANRELVRWMRAYNMEPSHRIKLRFYGFDSPTEMTHGYSPRRVLEFLLAYLGSMDPEGDEDRRQRIEPLLGDDSDWENPAALLDPSKSIGGSPAVAQLRMESEELVTELHIRRPEWIAKSDDHHYAEAVHFGRIATQLLAYHAGLARAASRGRVSRLLGMRDALMADNLAYIVSRERRRGNVLAFAQNMHLKRGEVRWQFAQDMYRWWPAGAHLQHMLGRRYAVIGTAVGVSSANGIAEPEPGTLESRLTASHGPARFIPTHRGEGLPREDIAALPVRSGSIRNATYFPLTQDCFTDYDWLAVLDSTQYARGGPAI